MKKVYYLSTCNTCKKILDGLGEKLDEFEKQEIKSTPITLDQVDQMRERSGSYEALFSRRSRKFSAMNLKDKKLTENDYRQLIHEEYTFLKRPVFILDDKIFIGSSAKVIENLKQATIS